MSVYIKGIGKPHNCRRCYFNISDIDCFITKGRIDRDDYSCEKECPITEIPTPHGDLIDRERIDYKNYKMHDGKGNLIVSDTFVDGVTWVNNCIYDTPIVIEAEMDVIKKEENDEAG